MVSENGREWDPSVERGPDAAGAHPKGKTAVAPPAAAPQGPPGPWALLFSLGDGRRLRPVPV